MYLNVYKYIFVNVWIMLMFMQLKVWSDFNLLWRGVFLRAELWSVIWVLAPEQEFIHKLCFKKFNQKHKQ